MFLSSVAFKAFVYINCPSVTPRETECTGDGQIFFFSDPSVPLEINYLKLLLKVAITASPVKSTRYALIISANFAQSVKKPQKVA